MLYYKNIKATNTLKMPTPREAIRINFIETTRRDELLRRGKWSGLDPFEHAFYLDEHKKAFKSCLKSLVFSSDHRIGVCCICFEEIKASESLHLPCAHSFHASCCEEWVSQHQNCPTCRANVRVAELIDGDLISVEAPDGKWRSAIISREETNCNSIQFSGAHIRGNLTLVNPCIHFIRDEGLMEQVSREMSGAYRRHKRRKQKQKKKKRGMM